MSASAPASNEAKAPESGTKAVGNANANANAKPATRERATQERRQAFLKSSKSFKQTAKEEREADGNDDGDDPNDEDYVDGPEKEDRDEWKEDDESDEELGDSDLAMVDSGNSQYPVSSSME